MITELLFWLNALAVALIVGESLLRRAGYLEAPFATAMIFATWFLPQCWVLLDGTVIEPAKLGRVLAMSLLSLLGLVAGWRYGLGKAPLTPGPLSVPVRALTIPVAVVTGFALAMNILIELRPVKEQLSGQWTGVITIYAFFASIAVVSLVLSLAMVLTRRNPATIALAAINVGIYFPKIAIYFRRSEIYEFAIAVLLALWFVKRKSISPIMIAVACVMGFFVLNGVSQLRQAGGGYQANRAGEIQGRVPSFEDLSAINWLEATDLSKNKNRLEVRNAAEYMEASDRDGTLTAGAQFWNWLVHAYVPAQFFGEEFKRSLRIGQTLEDLTSENLNYQGNLGGTATGFAHPYRDFWYFGSLVFAVMGLALGKLYRRAIVGGVLAYAAYGSLLGLSVLNTTHLGYFFFVQALLPLLVIWIISKFVNVGHPSRRARNYHRERDGHVPHHELETRV